MLAIQRIISIWPRRWPGSLLNLAKYFYPWFIIPICTGLCWTYCTVLVRYKYRTQFWCLNYLVLGGTNWFYLVSPFTPIGSALFHVVPTCAIQSGCIMAGCEKRVSNLVSVWGLYCTMPNIPYVLVRYPYSEPFLLQSNEMKEIYCL